MSEIIVSVVIPVYNEQSYIAACVESLLLQDYPLSNMEWIFVDGESSDKTKAMLKEYQARYPELIRLLDNPKRITPCAMNIGILASKGKYVVRMDAHAEYEKDYIRNCVHCLETTDAQNVGGLAETKGRGRMGNSIALLLSSRFGVGNSEFRINGSSGYADTVPFGAFRRELFAQLGGYDERLVRNQDNELNYRIRKNGGKLYLSRDIRFSYYCRDSLTSLMRMAFANGRWNVITMYLCPGSMGVRHFVPLAFVLSLIVLGIASVFTAIAGWLLAAELAAYVALSLLYSIKQAKAPCERLDLMYLFPCFHISYGVGSLRGLIGLIFEDYNRDYTAPRL